MAMAACKRLAGFIASASRTRLPSLPLTRSLSSTDPPTSNYTHDLDDINSKFAEAREEIELALESKETVYFDEEAQGARAAVKVVLDKYESLLSRLPQSDKGTVQRSMGLKMEQLKAELGQLDN